jgi:hypothetical protein
MTMSMSLLNPVVAPVISGLVRTFQTAPSAITDLMTFLGGASYRA